jgi:hypothetical protein
MKNEWEKVRNQIDELERTDKLCWEKLSNSELKVVLANLHKRDRKHWSGPAFNEIERRRYSRIIIIAFLTLIIASIGVVVGILQYWK